MGHRHTTDLRVTSEGSDSLRGTAGAAVTDRPPPPGDVVVRLRQVEKVFEHSRGQLTALHSTDLDIRRGEFLCVVGPSGCGKTTLLNILAGLEKQSRGEVGFGDLPPERPLLSVVFQQESVFPWLTVLDNAAVGLAARGVGKAQRRRIAGEVVSRMGLEHFADAYPHELSGGMCQRVNVARAFATDPHILLMDEPFGSLDEQTKLLLQDSLLDIWEGSRKTVLFITHSIDEAIRLADRVIVMTARPGRIKAERAVTIPRPRDLLEMQAHDEFSELRADVWDLLREEVLATRAQEEETQ